MTEPQHIAYGTGSGRELSLDLFAAQGPDNQRTAVLQFHGGGWRFGSPAMTHPRCAELAEHGITVLAVEYRLLPEAPWPSQIHDVKAAIRWTRAHAGELGVEEDRICVHGYSAGGHLALLAAGTPDVAELEGEGGNAGVSSRVAAVVALYPPIGFHASGPPEPTDPPGPPPVSEDGTVPAGGLFGRQTTEAEAKDASPIAHVGPDFPPTMLVHGTADTLISWRCSVQLHRALVDAGVEADLRLYAGQQHAFDAAPSFGREIANAAALFYRRTVSDRAALEAEVAQFNPFAAAGRGAG
jgi:acetyl esterase/lipase